MYFQPQTPLDVIGTSINYAATRKLKGSETLDLVESVIYCATVDQQSQVLEVILIWYPSRILCCMKKKIAVYHNQFDTQ